MIEQNKYFKTMKTIKITNLFILLLSLVIVTSCVQDDDFDTPDLTIIEPTIDPLQLTTITEVAGALSQAQDGGETLDFSDEATLYTYEETGDILEAYVISNDEAGNFFEEIILQDKLENPTIGIRLLLDVNPLYTRYEVGRKLYINLDGLSVGISNGVLTLGEIDGSRVGKIASSKELDYILRSATIGDVVPLPMSLDMLTNEMTNVFVRLEDVQFNRNVIANPDTMSFASGDLDEFDGERLLESCEGSTSVIFSTSTFADFKGLVLPVQRGSMNVILTKDFFGESFNVTVNSPTDITFDNPERCDPIEIDCGEAAAQGTENIFADNFESQSTNSLISGNGWTNYIQEGSEGWEAYTASGTNASLGISARCGSFNSGDASTVAWLITPAINLDAQNNETFVFQTSNSFSDGSNMEVLFSSDWDGTEANITSANWGVFAEATVVNDDDFFGDWIDSGIVDLSCAEGTIYIAFKYTGSGVADFDGTYELDEISIDYTN
jgi:hypothetical protein